MRKSVAYTQAQVYACQDAGPNMRERIGSVATCAWKGLAMQLEGRTAQQPEA